jgi:hypothetical protein
VGRVEIDYSGSSGSLTVDGSKVWAHWPQSEYWGWDFGISGSTPTSCLVCLHSPMAVCSGTQDRVGSRMQLLEESFFNFLGGLQIPALVQCDGSYLVASYESGEILILDLNMCYFI